VTGAAATQALARRLERQPADVRATPIRTRPEFGESVAVARQTGAGCVQKTWRVFPLSNAVDTTSTFPLTVRCGLQ